MKKGIFYLAISIVAGALVGASFILGLFSGLENFLEDRLFAKKPVNADIVILAVDSDSINKIGQWPWSREVFARAFLNLEKSRPRAVGFDVMLAEASRYGEKDDDVLAAALNKISYPVVFPIEAHPLILDE